MDGTTGRKRRQLKFQCSVRIDIGLTAHELHTDTPLTRIDIDYS
jgi:hypothetical protein